ncbi:hypothetical protein BYT27DRAFT_7254521 [Phlegmacium glaucopus]|nr:hypothetical protein BYT27DRAFT_7254521 [Phlegmacium glaucopus]
MSSFAALSPSHSANLLQILRRANAHYSFIASVVRVSIHPTYHARKRAAALRLTVSIQKALNLDPKQISTIPLPVLERVITPPPNLTKVVVGRERELARVGHPRTIPSYSRSGTPSLSPASVYACVTLTPDSTSKAQRGQSLASRWSMTPIDTQALPEGVAVSYNADYDKDMVLCSPTEAGQSIRFMVEPASPSNLLPDNKNKVARPLGIPVDVARPLSSGTDTSSPGSLSTGSSFTTSSRGPATPCNADGAEKIMIRIKRKSAEMDNDTLEKRPKYERKGWAISQRKLVQRTITLHSGRF